MRKNFDDYVVELKAEFAKSNLSDLTKRQLNCLLAQLQQDAICGDYGNYVGDHWADAIAEGEVQ